MLKIKRVVKPGDSIQEAGCRHCARAIRVGQVVAYATMFDAPGYRRLFVVHVSCLQALLESAPVKELVGDFEAEFKALQADMIRTGKGFPHDD